MASPWLWLATLSAATFALSACSIRAAEQCAACGVDPSPHYLGLIPPSRRRLQRPRLSFQLCQQLQVAGSVGTRVTLQMKSNAGTRNREGEQSEQQREGAVEGSSRAPRRCLGLACKVQALAPATARKANAGAGQSCWAKGSATSSGQCSRKRLARGSSCRAGPALGCAMQPAWGAGVHGWGGRAAGVRSLFPESKQARQQAPADQVR